MGGFWHPKLWRNIQTHLWCQDVKVPSSTGSAGELTFVPRRHSRVLGHPGDGGGEPVGAVVVAIESFTLFLPKTLPWACEKTRPATQFTKRGKSQTSWHMVPISDWVESHHPTSQGPSTILRETAAPPRGLLSLLSVCKSDRVTLPQVT